MSITIVDGVSDLVLFSLLRAAVLKKKKDRLQNAQWNVNRLRKRKKDARSTKRLPEPYYGVGDDAFVNCNTLLSPYGGTHLDM